MSKLTMKDQLLEKVPVSYTKFWCKESALPTHTKMLLDKAKQIANTAMFNPNDVYLEFENFSECAGVQGDRMYINRNGDQVTMYTLDFVRGGVKLRVVSLDGTPEKVLEGKWNQIKAYFIPVKGTGPSQKTLEWHLKRVATAKWTDFPNVWWKAKEVVTKAITNDPNGPAVQLNEKLTELGKQFHENTKLFQ